MRANQSLDGNDSVITMDGVPLHSAISGPHITADIPAIFYGKAGTHILHIITKRGTVSIQSNDVTFVVK